MKEVLLRGCDRQAHAGRTQRGEGRGAVLEKRKGTRKGIDLNLNEGTQSSGVFFGVHDR